MNGLATHLPILPVLLPLLAGIVLLALRNAPLALQRGLSLAATAALVPLAFALLAGAADGTQLVYKLGNWDAPFGIVLVADRLAAWMLMATALVALFALLHALRGSDTQGRHFHVLYQLQLFGLNGAFLTGDLFNLFVFFEILLLASYGLLLHGGGRLRVKAGLHFVVINLAGSTLFLFAVGTLYGVAGTLNMADLAVKLARTPPGNLALVETAGLLLFGVFALKAALLPLHLWLPAAYAHTSAPVAALFAIMTKVGAYSILRVTSLMFGADAGALANLLAGWLMPLALATLVAGMLGALASTALRQQIAYLTIASVGTLLAAFALGSVDGIAAGLYYLPHTTFATAALFLLAEPIARARGACADRFEPGPAMPGAAVLGGLFFVAAMAMAGLPPLSGFLGKFMLLRAALESPWLTWMWGAVLAGGLAGVIALARSGSLLFYRTQSSTEVLPVPRAADWLPAGALLLLLADMVVWADPLARYATATAAQLLAPQAYIDAVLGARP
ncbi:monovalent cation/H+ antiporter subunit D [Thiobacillus sp. 65-1402]|uniref:monovalent cation/H+ antiporter subunit D n=1 Tax=Thiobacillus sp. 65-1402 TaxID=1895861 RepID=UPI0009643F4C|nr:monovalent cation/H+ antiporter subunit D [Thiobacillus sp. 65-1402]OJW96533.1 MAG: monovalent cation/H+ antiporter subunit D [Thiobacillus sp. 65-1402]